MNVWKKQFISLSTAVFLLRIILGLIFFIHGSQKVLGIFGGNGLTATTQYFQSNMNIPLFFGYIASFTEFLGGIALLIGLFTRLAALGISINMFVAILVVHIEAGFFNPNGYEYPLTLLFISVVIILTGPGTFSLDHYVFKENPKK